MVQPARFTGQKIRPLKKWTVSQAPQHAPPEPTGFTKSARTDISAVDPLSLPCDETGADESEISKLDPEQDDRLRKNG